MAYKNLFDDLDVTDVDHFMIVKGDFHKNLTVRNKALGEVLLPPASKSLSSIAKVALLIFEDFIESTFAL